MSDAMTDASRNVDPAEVVRDARARLVKPLADRFHAMRYAHPTTGHLDLHSCPCEREAGALLDLWLSPGHRGDLLALLVPRDSESFEKMVEAGAQAACDNAAGVGMVLHGWDNAGSGTRETFRAHAHASLSAALAVLTEEE